MERATNSSLILYTTEDGLTKIEATFDRDTVWLSIDQMADLFQRNKSTISRHIGNIYKEGELDRTATVAKFATVQMEGERQVERQIEYYNLDVRTVGKTRRSSALNINRAKRSTVIEPCFSLPCKAYEIIGTMYSAAPLSVH